MPLVKKGLKAFEVVASGMEVAPLGDGSGFAALKAVGYTKLPVLAMGTMSGNVGAPGMLADRCRKDDPGKSRVN